MEANPLRPYSSPSDGCDVIDASIQIVKTKRRRKKRPKQKEHERVSSSQKSERITIPAIEPTSSSKSTPNRLNSTVPSFIEILSPGLTQRKRTASVLLVEEEPSEKYSKSLFSENSEFLMTESPIFNRTRDFVMSPAPSVTLNDTFLSGYDERLQNSQMMQFQLDRDWEDLSEELTPKSSSKNSHRQHLISPMEDYSPSEVTFNQAFHESNFELSSQCDYHSSESQQRSEVNDFEESVNERLRTQHLNQSLINEQNQQISVQLLNFECFVREKIGAAEDYVKKKLTQIEDSNLAVAKAINDLKRVNRDEPAAGSSHRKKPKRTTKSVMVMPKIPISKDLSLAILDSALKNTEYMNEFVSDISHIVTLNAYNPKKTVNSIMTKLFTLNLLIKYKWSRRTTTKKKPTFSSLTNVLRAIALLLASYMSEQAMRQEIKEFFKEIPQIYEERRRRYF